MYFTEAITKTSLKFNQCFGDGCFFLLLFLFHSCAHSVLIVCSRYFRSFGICLQLLAVGNEKSSSLSYIFQCEQIRCRIQAKNKIDIQVYWLEPNEYCICGFDSIKIAHFFCSVQCNFPYISNCCCLVSKFHVNYSMFSQAIPLSATLAGGLLSYQITEQTKWMFAIAKYC